ncbi:MAG: decaprenyl-phosphate phosphoribosyltransferase [candidate division Zixibacteria bacterium]|nr:decaprenyl-phosphate phosphoribosyltransferase [candidate division Zixibacteria bacterium]MBU1469069.1 decaprenyl-phosphate phosphoribosyltransferase [candidate division Zixibacteria bacterium]MBU2624645.1 decaprenyl-phosphate phosphoribosyltransferase [candidate division Zixibacteria bacterium]
MNLAKGLIRSLRPEQWIKNLIVFGALVFSKNFFDIPMIEKTFVMFALFCMVSSSIYLFNDVIDYEKDRVHPRKSKRPIASGVVSRKNALVLAAILLIVTIAVSWFVMNELTLVILLSYTVLNVLYSLVLKHIVILDVMTIAAGFVLRAVGGGIAISVPISAWLVVCTILLALFLGFGKRRHELSSLEGVAVEHRKILEHYSTYFLDQMISVVTASTVMAYTFYTLSPEVEQKLGVEHLEISVPFVLYGIFRYLYLIHKKDEGGSPSRLMLTDLPLLINVLLWFVTVLVLMVV